MSGARFEWDLKKDRENQAKHGVSFLDAQFAFADPHRVVAWTFPTVTQSPGIFASVRLAMAF